MGTYSVCTNILLLQMNIAGRPKLNTFKQKHADACSHIDAWLAEAKEASWKSPHDVKAKYPKASILKGGVVIFNIKGNDYRLKVKIEYKSGSILIMNVGTHDEYMNKW